MIYLLIQNENILYASHNKNVVELQLNEYLEEDEKFTEYKKEFLKESETFQKHINESLPPIEYNMEKLAEHYKKCNEWYNIIENVYAIKEVESD
jgi:hypothetical protein